MKSSKMEDQEHVRCPLLTCIKCVLYARHWSQILTHITLFIPGNDSLSYVLLLFDFTDVETEIKPLAQDHPVKIWTQIV